MRQTPTSVADGVRRFELTALAVVFLVLLAAGAARTDRAAPAVPLASSQAHRTQSAYEFVVARGCMRARPRTVETRELDLQRTPAQVPAWRTFEGHGLPAPRAPDARAARAC